MSVIKNIAAAFGKAEDTPIEELIEEVKRFAARMSEADDETRKTIAQKLEMDEEATGEQIAEVLHSIADAIEEEAKSKADGETEDEEEYSVNVDSLAAAANSVKRARGNIRLHTGAQRDGGGDGYRGASGTATPNPNAGASKRFGSPGVLTNTSKYPLWTMMNAVKAGKAQNYEYGQLGGHVVRQELSERIIPLLREALVFDQLGVRIERMDDFVNMSIPKMSKAPNDFMPGVNEDLPEDEAEWQSIMLRPKPIGVVVRVPKRMLNAAYPTVEADLTTAIVGSLQRGIERRSLYSVGAIEPGSTEDTGASVLGLKQYLTSMVAGGQLSADHIIDAGGGAPVIDNHVDLISAIEADDVEFDDSGKWLFRPEVHRYWTNLSDDTGQLINPAYWDQGLGFAKTNTVKRLAGGADTFVGNWVNMVLGMGQGIELEQVNDFALTRALQVGFVAWTWFDVQFEYAEAFGMINNQVVRPVSS